MDALFIVFAKYVVFLSAAILGIYWLRVRQGSKLRMAAFAFVALAITYGIGLAAGHFYDDPRPFVVGGFAPLIPHAADNGFPSDHALLAAGLAMVGLYWSRRLGVALWSLAFIVAAGRVYVGVHHPIDVIGSMAIALAAVSLVYSVFQRTTPRSAGDGRP